VRVVLCGGVFMCVHVWVWVGVGENVNVFVCV